MKILLLSDVESGATESGLRPLLVGAGYSLTVLPFTKADQERFTLSGFDLLLLERTDSHESEICKCCTVWRAQGVTLPILVLSNRGTVAEKVQGLDSGADDYLSGPFDFKEVIARIRALRRRTLIAGQAVDRRIVVGALVVDSLGQTAILDGKPLKLTAREFRLLDALAVRVSQVVSRTVLWEAVWESNSEPNSNVIDVYIGYLRQRLGEHSQMIRTVRGKGYQLGD